VQVNRSRNRAFWRGPVKKVIRTAMLPVEKRNFQRGPVFIVLDQEGGVKKSYRTRLSLRGRFQKGSGGDNIGLGGGRVATFVSRTLEGTEGRMKEGMAVCLKSCKPAGKFRKLEEDRGSKHLEHHRNGPGKRLGQQSVKIEERRGDDGEGGVIKVPISSKLKGRDCPIKRKKSSPVVKNRVYCR